MALRESIAMNINESIFDEVDFKFKEDEVLSDEIQRKYVSIYQAALELDGKATTPFEIKILNSKEKAAEILIASNFRLLAYNAKKICNGNIQYFDDLIQEGRMGLLHAIEKFDQSYENKFTTYANNWIYDYISKFYNNVCRNIYLPKNSQLLLMKLNKAKNTLTQKLMRDPTVSELAKELKISDEEVVNLINANKFTKSLDSETDNEDGLKALNLLKSEENPFTHCSKENLLEALDDGLDKLDDIEISVLEWRYGLHNKERKTIDEIALELNITKSRVSKIEKNAMKKLATDKNLIECRNENLN